MASFSDLTPSLDKRDFWLEVAADNNNGMTGVNKFGHNNDISPGGFESVWHGGGLYNWSTGAEKVNVVSTSTDDVNTTGTGAWTVLLEGLDSSYNEITETVNLNGMTNVLSTNSYLRLQRAIIKSAGSTGKNQGEISMIQETSADKLVDMPALKNQTLVCTWTVPAGKTFYLRDFYYGLVSGKGTIIELYIRPFGEVFQIKKLIETDSTQILVWKPFLKVEEKSDIDLRALASIGNHQISSGFDGVLVDN